MHILIIFSDCPFFHIGETGVKESQFEAKAKFDHRAPVLASCCSDSTHGYSGGYAPL